jgi:uncharacterized RmlC-like cupin family protein
VPLKKGTAFTFMLVVEMQARDAPKRIHDKKDTQNAQKKIGDLFFSPHSVPHFPILKHNEFSLEKCENEDM